MSREMKDSGIDYVGDIPFSWEVIPNKYVMKKEKDICDKWNNENVLSLTMNGVIIRDLINPVGKMPTTFDGYQYVYPNNLLMCLFDIDVTPRCIGIVKNFGVTSPAYSRFTLYDGYSTRYYYYYYLYLDNKKELLHLAKNLRHSFTEEELGYLKTPVPPLSEQQKIADFLDEKVKEIDNAIEKTKETIELYKKYKQAVIDNAVIGGLNNQIMKSSGLDWCPNIPNNWTVTSPKNLFALRNEKAFPGERQLTASQQYGVIYQDDYMRMTGTRVVVVEKDFSILKHVEKGDFVISMRSFQGGIEYSDNSGCISSAYVMLIPNKKYVYDPYFKWLFKSAKYINAIQSTTNLVRDGQAMRYSNFAQVKLFLVPLNEQKRIAEYLDDTCKKIDAVIDEKEEMIQHLNAYKKSLIYEYVTGKKEVE